MAKKVAKSLTPEEKAILGNIRSLMDQLDSEEISEEVNNEVENAAEEEEIETEECEEEEKVEKSSAPEEVANNGAQERTTVEDTDIDEALKIVKAFCAKRQVKKSANTNAQVAKGLIALASRMDEIQSTLDGITQGIRQAPVRKSTQAFDPNKGTLADVMTSLFKNE